MSIFSKQNVSASSVTLTIPSSSLSLDIKPNSGTIFQKSSPATITVATDSSYGYSLSIHSKNSDSERSKSNDLLNGSSKIASIVSAMSEDNFQTFGDNNTWGYLPSKLNSSANNDFQPGPTSEATILDTTDASSKGTDYDITLATKIDSSLPAGTYHNTFVLTAISNEPPYDNLMQGQTGYGWAGCDDLGVEETVELTDTRDNKTYSVAKLKDGNCWMTDNLKIQNYKLTTNDSDVASNFRLPVSTNTPNPNNSYTSTDLHIDETYGGYYTWYTATAGEGTKSHSSGNVLHSICPKGWRLPTNAEFQALNEALGGNTGSAGATTLMDKPNNFLRGGGYRDGSPYNTNIYGYYWSSTAYYPYDYSAYTFNFSNSSVNPTSGSDKYYENSIRCIVRSGNPYEKVGTMQTVEEWGDSIKKGKAVISNDSRDGKEYTVARLKDDRLWMTKNLELGDTKLLNRTLTSADSDLPTQTTFVMPNSSASGFSDNTASNIYVDSNYSGYYTYNAATANTGSSILRGEAPGSICPKGWRLPTMAEYTDLASQYNVGRNLQFDTPRFIISGYYADNTLYGRGDGKGFYWSSTTYDNSQANEFYLDDTFIGTDGDKRSRGFAVRCIARTDDTREPININDTLQNVENWEESVQDLKQPVIVKDSRDNKEYTVARLKDGRLWMTQNLALGDDSLQNRTLTSVDSDLPASTSFIMPENSTSGFSDDATANVYVDSTYGGYYTYNTATADLGSSISGSEASGSICPKGWRLPTQAEYTNLISQYGKDDSAISSNLRNQTPKFNFSGYYNSSLPYVQGSGGYYWTSTTYDNSHMWYLDLSNSKARVISQYRHYGYSVRCIAHTDLTELTMQTVSRWSGDVTNEQTVKAKDIRNNKEYTIARLADGKLWMTENLQIQNYKLTTADSDVAGDFEIPASVNNPNTGYAYDSKELYVDETYGGYYTWYTATAGEGTRNKSSGDTTHSICPKGWKLPSRQDFIDLDKAFGGTGNNSQSSSTNVGGGKTLLQMYQDKDGANFLMGGYYNGGSSNNVGSEARYWSASAYPSGSSNAYYLRFDSSGVGPQYNFNKYVGMSVRCISRQ